MEDWDDEETASIQKKYQNNGIQPTDEFWTEDDRPSTIPESVYYVESTVSKQEAAKAEWLTRFKLRPCREEKPISQCDFQDSSAQQIATPVSPMTHDTLALYAESLSAALTTQTWEGLSTHARTRCASPRSQCEHMSVSVCQGFQTPLKEK